VVPTCECLFGMGLIALAYIYLAVSMLPNVGWEPYLRPFVAVLAICTPGMCVAYHRAWASDPGILAPRPEYIIDSLLSESLTMNEVVVPAMTKKVARAEYFSTDYQSTLVVRTRS
jgi:hypothetical protein